MTLEQRRDAFVRVRCPDLSEARVHEVGEALDQLIALALAVHERQQQDPAKQLPS